MQYFKYLIPGLSITCVYAQQAQVVSNNPSDVVLRADFPSGFSQNVVGIVQFYSLNGTTKVHVDVTGLPKNAGLFSYHIHDLPVGADGNCEGVGKHFNPFGSSSDCEAQQGDQFCQVGDLSGKHGLINTTCFETFFYDPYISLNPASSQYIGNRALVIHLENLEKLACATIKPSSEPEDLLLLNVETEALEVAKFEEISGIINSENAPIIQSLVVNDESDNENVEEEELSDPTLVDRRDEEISSKEESSSSVEESEDDEDSFAEQDEKSEEDNADFEEDDEDNDLDELIYEDIEKHRNSTLSNSTTGFNISANATSSSDDDDDLSSAAATYGYPSLVLISTIAAIGAGFGAFLSI